MSDALNSVVAERAPQGVSRLIELLDDDHRGELIFAINGERYSLPAREVDPTVTLSDFLCTKTRHTGTKVGCGDGGCGACAVMVLQYSAIDDKVTHRSINTCLCPLARLDGASVTTVEGLGDSVRGLRRPSP